MKYDYSSEVKQKRASLLKATENMKKVLAKRKHNDEEFEVESIISHTVRNEQTIYTVSWVGYPGELTEVPERDLKNCRELLQEYKSKLNNSGSLENKRAVDARRDSILREENNEKRSPGRESCSVKLPSSTLEKNVEREGVMDEMARNTENGTSTNSAQQVEKKRTSTSALNESKPNGSALCIPSNKRAKRTKLVIAPDAQLGYTNGCIVDAYKGFSSNYAEPVVLVSYKDPLPCGFENKPDEIVPIRLIAEADPQTSIVHDGLRRFPVMFRFLLEDFVFSECRSMLVESILLAAMDVLEDSRAKASLR